MKVRIRKHDGDDAYSWAVFVDDKVVPQLTGLSRSQAIYYKRLIEEEAAQSNARFHRSA